MTRPRPKRKDQCQKTSAREGLGEPTSSNLSERKIEISSTYEMTSRSGETMQRGDVAWESTSRLDSQRCWWREIAAPGASELVAIFVVMLQYVYELYYSWTCNQRSVRRLSWRRVTRV